MPSSPWRKSGTPDPNGEYVALLSYLPLKSYWQILPFFFYTSQVVRQLSVADGLLGYALQAHPFSKQFWTLSAWKSDQALQAFVRNAPHVRIMTSLRPHMSDPSFVRWTVSGAQLPLRWEDALARQAAESRSKNA